MRFIKKHKKLVIILSIILVILIAIGVYVYIGYLKAKKDVAGLQSDIMYLKQAQADRSLVNISTGLTKVQGDIANFQSTMQYFIPLRYTPVVSGYYINASYILSAASSIDTGIKNVSAAAYPVANALGYGPNPVTGSAKIAAFVQNLPRFVSAADNSMSYFQAAQQDLDLVNPANLPSVSVKGVNIKNSYTTYKNDFDNAVNFIPQLDTMAPVIATALGSPLPQNYLLLFQNDKELRPGGGFTTAYGYLNFNKGSLGPINTADIYTLDNLETLNVPAPVQLQQYNAATRWYLRDANMSPDIPTTAAQIQKFYDSIPEADQQHLDGMVFIDTQFVASLLNAVGPIKVPGYNVTVNANNAAYDMEYYAEKVDAVKCAGLATCNRKGFLNTLLETIKVKVFAAQGNSLLKLLSIAQDDLNQKHLIFFAYNQHVENLISSYNWGGVFPQQTGDDFFGLSEANLGGAKADFYIKRNITQTIKQTANGLMETSTIVYTNNQVYDDWLNGPYTAWVRFYLPEGSKLVSINGVNGTLRTYNELGYSVVDDHIRVPVKYTVSAPAASLTVTLSYYLPQSISSSPYSLYVWKEPGIKDMQVNVNDEGKKQSADIVTDKTFTF